MIKNIQNIIKKISEKYYATISSNWRGDNIPVEVFINPSRGELMKLTRGGKHPLRFILNLEGDLLVWDFEGAEHDEVSRQTKNPFRIKGTIYTPSYIEFFKVKNPEMVYANIKGTYLDSLLTDDYKDNLSRKDLVNT